MNCKCVAYLRVSTDEQASSGLGLESQRESILRTSERLNVPILDYFTDEGISGSAGVEKRLGLMSAIETLNKGDFLVVAKRDRIARDTMLSCWIEKEVQKRGARIISASGEGTESDSPTDILMRRIIDAFSEYERQVIRARTKAALKAKRSRGEKTGGIVEYGFKLDSDGKTLIKDEFEQNVISEIVSMRKQGFKLQQIANHLDSQGIKSKTGKKWNCMSVSNIYKRQI